MEKRITFELINKTFSRQRSINFEALNIHDDSIFRHDFS